MKLSWLAAITLASVSFSVTAKSPVNSANHTSRPSVTVTPQAKAGAKVLYYVDYVIGNDAYGNALAGLGITPTYTNDPYSFDSLLLQGGWDLVIALQQNGCSSGAFDTDLKNWVASGGKAIYTDWCASSNPSLISTFGGSPSGSVNFTSLSSINNILFGSAALSNPGWGIYAVGYILSGGSALALYENGDAGVVLGANRNTILNGTLADSFSDPAQGTALATGEIKLLLAKK